MIYRFYLTIGSTVTEVFPLNFLESRLVDQKEGDHIFYRRKFVGSLTFVNNNGDDDFDLLYNIYETAPCTKIVFSIEKSGDAYWDGCFSVTDGRFDIDRCTFEVTPQPDDAYVNILDGVDTQYDILACAAVTTRAYKHEVIDVTYTRNRWLVNLSEDSVLEYLAGQIATGCTVTSTFFNDATNPATLVANKTTSITIAQKSDIIRPTSSEAAGEALMSWSELMNILWVMFQVKWDYVSSTNTIRVEHVSFWSESAGLDLRTQLISEAGNKFTYLRDKMPKYEKFSFMESIDTNFTPKTIWYDSQCVDQNGETNSLEKSVNVTTDLEYIISNPEEIADEGFVMLCNELIGSDLYVKLTKGAYNNDVKLNAYLSWGNLLNAFYRHNRILPTGYLNNNLTTFWTSQKNKVQPCHAIVCPSDGYDASDVITTEFGETYLGGQKGEVQISELNPHGELRLSLLYSDPSVNNTGVVDDPNVILVVQEGDLLSATLTSVATSDITITIVNTNCEGAPQANITWTISTGERYSSKPIVHREIVSMSADGGWTIDFQYDPDYECV